MDGVSRSVDNLWLTYNIQTYHGPGTPVRKTATPSFALTGHLHSSLSISCKKQIWAGFEPARFVRKCKIIYIVLDNVAKYSSKLWQIAHCVCLLQYKCKIRRTSKQTVKWEDCSRAEMCRDGCRCMCSDSLLLYKHTHQWMQLVPMINLSMYTHNHYTQHIVAREIEIYCIAFGTQKLHKIFVYDVYDSIPSNMELGWTSFRVYYLAISTDV